MVRFTIEHRFDASVSEVESAMTDISYFDTLSGLPGIAPPRVLERTEDGGGVHLRVRYEFTGQLPTIARSVLGSGRLVWVQASTLDRSRHRIDFVIQPETYRERLDCHGVYQLDPDGPDRCTRMISGDVSCRVPLLASRAERAIVSGLVERLEVEAELLERWLTTAR